LRLGVSEAGERPLHNTGHCTPYSEEARRRAAWVTCRECLLACHLVQHNGGFVLLDALGWPWPKHPCFANRFALPADRVSIARLIGNAQLVVVPPLAKLTVCNAGDLIQKMSEPDLWRALKDVGIRRNKPLCDLIRVELRRRREIQGPGLELSQKRSRKQQRLTSLREQSEKFRGKDW